MEPSCSSGPGDSKPGPTKMSAENGSDSDSDGSATPNNNDDMKNLNNNTSTEEQIDELERKDFEEENMLLSQCDKMHPSPPFSGDLASANSSLDSSTETLSGYQTSSCNKLPHCSKRQFEDSNATIRNMLQKRKLVIDGDSLKSNKLNLYKSNFMKSLLNGGKPSSPKLKEFTSKFKKTSPLKTSVVKKKEIKPYDVTARPGPIRPLFKPSIFSTPENNNDTPLTAPCASAAADVTEQAEAPAPVPEEDVPEEPAEEPVVENPGGGIRGPGSRMAASIPVRPLTPAAHERGDAARPQVPVPAPGQNRPRPPAENYDGLTAHQLIARAQQIALAATYSNPNVQYEDPIGYRLKMPNFANSFNDDSDEDFRGEPQEELHCTCLSSHEASHVKSAACKCVPVTKRVSQHLPLPSTNPRALQLLLNKDSKHSQQLPIRYRVVQQLSNADPRGLQQLPIKYPSSVKRFPSKDPRDFQQVSNEYPRVLQQLHYKDLTAFQKRSNNVFQQLLNKDARAVQQFFQDNMRADLQLLNEGFGADQQLPTAQLLPSEDPNDIHQHSIEDSRAIQQLLNKDLRAIEQLSKEEPKTSEQIPDEDSRAVDQLSNEGVRAIQQLDEDLRDMEQLSNDVPITTQKIEDSIAIQQLPKKRLIDLLKEDPTDTQQIFTADPRANHQFPKKKLIDLLKEDPPDIQQIFTADPRANHQFPKKRLTDLLKEDPTDIQQIFTADPRANHQFPNEGLVVIRQLISEDSKPADHLPDIHPRAVQHSIPQDEDADDEEETVDESIEMLKKRKPEYTPVRKPTPVKKFCSDKPGSSRESPEPESPKVSPGTSHASTSSLQGPPDMKQWLNRFQIWSNSEKVQALDALISRCSPGQVRHMMKSIEPIFQRDFISLLPKELALTVLGYLGPKDLLRAAQTCKYWQFLADDNLLWKEQCRRIGIVSCKKVPRSLPKCASPWKAAYMRHYLIVHNWLYKPVNKPIIMRGHDDHVITCLQFSGNRILSGSDDTTLKVWSAVSGKCLRTLVGHSGGVWSSQMVGDLVISGSTDRTLRVWNARSGHCYRVLAGHTSTVRCMHLHKNKVVSGSRDATLRVWSIFEGRCLKVLIGHLAAVRCVQYDGRVVVSGAYDYFVKVWNPESGECLHTLAGHTNRVYSLQFDGVHVVSGSLDTSIRVWDVETGQLKHTLIGHQSLTSGMELRSNILVSGNADSTVKVWDITTGHCLHTLSGPNKHQSAVTCLQSSNRFVITSSDDGTVKMWDLRTGEFIRNLVRLGSGGSGGVVWRIRASSTKLVCAVGSRNGTEETKLLVLDFDLPGACRKCDE